MTVPRITAVRLGGSPALPLLVLGPSLGTSARALWSRSAAQLTDRFEILAWDLPGHGSNVGATKPFTIAELAGGVLEMIDDMLAERGARSSTFTYAGDSVGGAVGLQLMLDAPERVDSAVLMSTAARIGEPEGWLTRAASVRASGTPSMIEGSVQRWFAPEFLGREPEVGATLLHALQDADDEGYALVCEALAAFDVRDRLDRIRPPVLAVAGSLDVPTPPADLQAIASGVRNGRLVVLDGVAHLPPAEQPGEVARLIRGHADGGQPVPAPTTVAGVREAGMTVRREVLGDGHVDRATAEITDLTADFQDFITQYAWGSVWTRPGLDRRSRSLITLTALVARGHHEELAMHVRAARTNGLTNDEIKELLLQTAIYCGVPDANTAYRIAQRVLDELDSSNP
ncbi:bifunctional 3-oxoadipate enol-lactonase/4-carboxymuconolactone decarboxylase PcaDC [Aeromicrobium wangtongii]|uniref:bifunctional 3-oxoadipate enol-lactonase/4-carboxymuconolactone decarboxylase PcaDC n=1 Tax=Aeromicrobium wangtongii TaxID=2969247 RepID=UPI00201739EA|nr:4-carboxymuconolactone decarboxylase [Aeromicrobium wangtongii]MCL3819428.1 4-carboxymuconolactone decarboxylase [Aeromicrobium wangtongii]